MMRQKDHNLQNMIYSGKMDNEPEEGEIVDYYEIISSDEEYMVRQRIQELEAKNKEIEQIAVISNSYEKYVNIPYPNNNTWNKNYAYTHQNHLKNIYNQNDPSSISNEYCASRKHKSRRSRYPKKKRNHPHFSNHSKPNVCRRKRSSRHRNNSTRSRHKHYKDENYCYEIYSDSSSTTQYYSNEDNIPYPSDENNYIDRKTLRFAISRNLKDCTSVRNKATLKRCLLNKEHRKERRTASKLMQIENEDNLQIETIEDSSDSLEEKELRLIALKSAIHKKHMRRKKRDAETAYSPTDFENLFDSNPDKNDIEMDLVVDGEIQGIDNTSSPISSPKLLLSPQHCAEETQCSQSCMVNTKVVDMEIATSDSDIESPKWLTISTLPTVPILPSDSHWRNAKNVDFKNAFECIKLDDQERPMDMHVPAMKLQPTQPPTNFAIKEAEQIAPNPLQCYEENPMGQEMEIDCIDITGEEEAIKLSTEEEDEEELALRALLLSQFQTSKNKRGKKPTTPTSESILKEAVRRFKLNAKENNTTIELTSEDHLINTELKCNDNKSSQNIKNSNFAITETNRAEIVENKKPMLEKKLCLEKSNSEIDTIQPMQECLTNTYVGMTRDCSDQLSNNSLMEAMKNSMAKREQVPNSEALMIKNCPKLTETTVSQFSAGENHKNNLNNLDLTYKIRSQNIKMHDKNVNKNILNLSQDPKILPTYSVLRSRKIVKPNKIINNIPADIPRKTFKKRQKNANCNLVNNKININLTNASAQDPKLEPTNSTNNKNHMNSRLITNIERAKTICKVPNLIISLQNQPSSPSSLSHSSFDSATENTCNTPVKLIHDYYDNDSPLSLNLEHNASFSPSTAVADDQPNMSDGKFEAKLNDFLKTMRSKVQAPNAPEQHMNVQTAMTQLKPLANTNLADKATPKAVRHLSQAAQAEYRSLVYRMKMLENRRKSLQNSKTLDQCNKVKKPTTIDTNPSKTNLKINELRKKYLKNKICHNNNEIGNNNGNNQNQNADNLKELNTDNNCNHKSAQTFKQVATTATATTTTTAADIYEKSYKKIGIDIVNYLEYSLRLVENAKSAKIRKLQLENRINALKNEIDLLERQQRLEQLKITTIYPNISKTNTIITNLKHKRLQILKTLLKLGDNKISTDFRNDNGLKLQITEKSKLLSENIKLVNSLQKHNIHEYIEMENQNAKGNTNTTTTTTTISTTTTSVSKQAITAAHTNPSSIANDHNASSIVAMDFQCGINDAGVLKTKSENNNVEVYSNDSASPPPAAEFNDSNNRNDLTYISPLDHLRNTQSDLDPQAILCPFDLRGSCQDDNCCYLHLKTPDAPDARKE